MPDDLVERLRSPLNTSQYDGLKLIQLVALMGVEAQRIEAADRITALTARLAALKQATGEDVVEMAMKAYVVAWHAAPKGKQSQRGVEAVLSAIAAPLRAQALQPIETAPRDRPIIVYAPARDGLPEMASMCQWHPDAGFCIDEMREPTHWMEKPTIRAGGAGG